MKIQNIKNMALPGEVRNSAMLELQKELNQCLKEHFENSKNNGRDYLASTLIKKVESIVDKLNNHGYKLGRNDYGGDINYENSEQWYSNGNEMGTGLIIQFLGYTAEVSWQDENTGMD